MRGSHAGFFPFNFSSIPFDEASAELVFVTFQDLLAARLVCWMHDEMVRTMHPLKTRSGGRKPMVKPGSLLSINQVM